MFFHVFRKIKIRKLHIFTFLMNFYIFSKFVVLTRVGTGSEPGRNIQFENARNIVVLIRVGAFHFNFEQ